MGKLAQMRQWSNCTLQEAQNLKILQKFPLLILPLEIIILP